MSSPRLLPWALGLCAAALCLWVSSAHGVRFVDGIGHSRRAHELWAGSPIRDGLYPLGYPLLLGATKLALGAVLPAARLLSALAVGGLVGAATARLGVGAGLWLLVQVPTLQWGSTEGTDALAACASLAAVLAGPRPMLAGGLLGLAACTRWTALAALPAVLWSVGPGGRLPAMGGLLLGFSPHVLVGFATGSVMLPDQSLNLAIASGGPGGPPPEPGGALARLPAGLLRAGGHAFVDPYAAFGAGCLLLAAAFPQPERSPVRPVMLAASLHLLAVAAVFSNPRLALPTTLAAALGPAALAWALARWVPRAPQAGAVLLAAASLALLLRTLPLARAADPDEQAFSAMRAALGDTPGPVLANSPWVYTESNGWLVPGVQLGGLRVTPRTTAAELAALADREGFHALVIDSARARRDLAGMRSLVEAKESDVEGWTLRARKERWRVWVR